MTFEILQEFCTVVDFQNISKAADHLYISQPTLSRHISDLEQEFGVQLIVRDSRTFLLTSAGRMLYDSALALISEQKEMINKVRSVRDQKVPRNLIIACPDIRSARVFESCQKYLQAYPDTNFSIHAMENAYCLRNTLQQKADIGFIFSYEYPSDLYLTELACMAVDRSDWCVAAAACLPVSARQSISFFDLTAYRFITTNHINYQFFNARVPEEYSLGTLDGVLNQCMFSTVQTALMQVRSGAGIAVLPRAYAEIYSDLCLIPLEELETSFEVLAVWLPEQAKQSSGLASYLELLETYRLAQ